MTLCKAWIMDWDTNLDMAAATGDIPDNCCRFYQGQMDNDYYGGTIWNYSDICVNDSFLKRKSQIQTNCEAGLAY